MANAPLHSLTATQIAAGLRARNFNVTDVARSCLDRIAARDKAVRAWTLVDRDLVLREAARLDAASVRGPLHGVPVGVKDVIYTADMPTQHNSAIYKGFFPQIDAASVAVLRAAGALILGKLDTVEFAINGRRAATHNPHDLARTPGGSSSGSAAAVADFHVPLALGTQTGGSTIRPASYCGVFGLKPTWGAVSAEGFKVCSPTLDTIGFFARSPDDFDLLCDVFRVHDDGLAGATVALAGARVALCRSPVWDKAEPATQTAMRQAEEALRAAGAQVEEFTLPAEFEGLTDAHRIVMQCEIQSSILPEFLLHPETLYAEIKAQVANEPGYTRAALLEAHNLAARCRAKFDELAAPFDFVLTPSVSGEAPAGLENTGAAIFNRIWTLLHTPCVNVPGLTGPSGLPVGLTITGPRFSDRRVIRAARELGRLLQADQIRAA